MFSSRYRNLLSILVLFTLSFIFTAGDCGTDNEDPPIPGTVAPPTNVEIAVDQVSSSFVTIRWTHSTTQTNSAFARYRIVTYQLDSANNIVSVFKNEAIDKATTTHNVSPLTPMIRYQSFISAELSDNTKSDSVATKVYGAVFRNNGEIDEYQATGSAESGYGWNMDFGVGTQYAFTSINSGNIDLHLRDAGGLRFYSPDQFQPGVRTTMFDLVGTGQSAFDETELLEPSSNSIVVAQDNVYLLKSESSNYVKIWVKEIQTGGAYRTVLFDYKVQPIDSLRLVKRR